MGVVQVFRRVLTVLVSVLLIALLAPSSAQALEDGEKFNNPVSPQAATRNALGKQVISAINLTPAGEKIQIAAYSFDRKDVADALVKAHRRGVRVQIVLNDNWISPQTRRLRTELGGNPKYQNFLRLCHGSCRGGAGNLHMKVYAFTRSGSASDVVITGSANMTDRAVQLQWNDLVTLRNVPGLHDAFVKVFNQLKYDKAVDPRWVYYEQPGLTAQFYRTQSGEASTRTVSYSRTPTAAEDPVMNRLKAIDCAAQPGTGINGKTAIRIMMYGWNGDRGVWIANEVAQLKKQGCDIKIITSVAGGQVIKILREAGIPVRSADYKYIYNEDGTSTVDFYSHLKGMAISGTYNGVATRALWTGSENWSGMSFLNDELCIGLIGSTWQQGFFSRFTYMNTYYTHKFGIYPTTTPAYRG